MQKGVLAVGIEVNVDSATVQTISDFGHLFTIIKLLFIPPKPNMTYLYGRYHFIYLP